MQHLPNVMDALKYLEEHARRCIALIVLIDNSGAKIRGTVSRKVEFVL